MRQRRGKNYDREREVLVPFRVQGSREGRERMKNNVKERRKGKKKIAGSILRPKWWKINTNTSYSNILLTFLYTLSLSLSLSLMQ